MIEGGKLMRNLEIVGFEHLHLHSDYSLLDGYGMVEEYAARAYQINQKFLTISDHGMLGAVPRQIKVCEKMCDKHGKDTLSPIYAAELYVNRLQPAISSLKEMQDHIAQLNDKEKEEVKQSAHLLAIAYNEEGYKNLVRLTSWGWTKGFYRRPRVNYEQLLKHKEGLYFTSCCYASEVGKAFDKGGEEAGFAMIEQYIEMFGKDHYFLEIMLLDFNKQKPYDAFIVKAHEKYGLKLILTNDCHYCRQEDSKYQRLMLMVQTKNTILDIERKLKEEGISDLFELQDANLWMKSEEELNAKWLQDYRDIIPYELFCEAKRNTVKICEKAKGVQLDRSLKLPVFPDADEKLKEEVMRGFKFRNLPQTKEYVSRLKEELGLITRKGFSTYFLIQKMMTDEARRWCREVLGGDGTQAVGPGRGCLTYNTPVVVPYGKTKLLGEVQIGDQVIDRYGQIQIVENKFEYDVDEELLNICSYYGDKQGVTLTKDHKVLVEKVVRPKNWDKWSTSTKSSRKTFETPQGNLEWIKASEIEVGDWVFTPQPIVEEKSFLSFDLGKYCNGKELRIEGDNVVYDLVNPLTNRIKKRTIMPRHLSLDKDWYVLLGIFTGDGWLRSNKSSMVGFCFEEGDVFGLSLLKKKMHEIGAEYKICNKYKNKKVVQVNVKNRFLYLMFKDIFCDYEYTSQTKHCPSFVFEQNEENRIAFLRGLHLSDGHEDYNNKFTTSSFRLANEIRFLVWQCREPASFACSERLDKRSGRIGKEYSIKTPRMHGISLNGYRQEYCFKKLENGFLTRIRKIELVQNVKKVYDIQVSNQHNYLTSSFVVHNSAVGALTCYCLGITDVDPIYEGLLFSRFLSEARGGRSIILEFPKNIDPLPPEEVFVA